MKNRRNYYRVLQVQPDAPFEIIQASYRTLMQKLKHHPDLGGDSWNAAVINEAFAVLSNPEKRRAYDQKLGPRLHQSTPETRARPTTTTSNSTSKPKQTARATGPKIRRCVFCQTPEPTRAYGEQNETCPGCASPLILSASITTVGNARQAMRIEQAESMSLWPKPGQAAIACMMHDLSPTGLRLELATTLPIGSVVKLENPTLSAIAEVTRVTLHSPGRHFAGLRFLRLAMRTPKGTFVTARA